MDLSDLTDYMNVAIRVDASSVMGVGHFMRCFTLARQMQEFGAKIRFLCQQMPGPQQRQIIESGFELILFPKLAIERGESDELSHSKWLGGLSQKLDAKLTINELNDQTWDWLIVDHYSLDYRWESLLRRYVRQIMAIDDLADRDHDADILLDQNIYTDPEGRYRNRVSNNCQLLLGADHVLLRPEFSLRKSFLAERSGRVQRIFVFFGGSDEHNYTEPIIDSLSRICADEIFVDVVVGDGHSRLSKIQEKCIQYKFQLYINVDAAKMADLMAIADLAIGAGGISTYERLYMLLPSLLIPTSLNQEEPLNAMRHMGLIRLFMNQFDFEMQLKNILLDGVPKVKDSVKDGSKGIAKAIYDSTISIRSINRFDIRRTFKWFQDQRLRESFLMLNAPNVRQHFNYWRKLKDDASQRAYSILRGGKHVGNCGLKNINIPEGDCELWIYIGDSFYRGMGIGKTALQQLLGVARKIGCNSICLHVNKKNKPAVHLYFSLGFRISQDSIGQDWHMHSCEVIKMEARL